MPKGAELDSVPEYANSSRQMPELMKINASSSLNIEC